MGKTFLGYIVGAAALTSAAASAGVANAACGDGSAMKPALWRGGAAEQGALLTRASMAGPNSIVGLWSIQFFAGGNMIDFGYAAWHSDGTEIMNSGGRAPATENFCLGVWAQNGPFSYKLNHFALSYDPSGSLNAKVNIKEDVVLDPKGNDFSGAFTLDVFDPNSGAPLQHVAGRIVGHRVTVN